MSDLAATSCGCNSCDGGNNGCSCIIWIILILCCFNGNNSFGSCGSCNDNDNCNCVIWIVLILLFCGNNFCGNNSCC